MLKNKPVSFYNCWA